MIHHRFSSAAVAALSLSAATLGIGRAAATSQPAMLPEVVVTAEKPGTADAASGSAATVTTEQIGNQNYTNPARILQQLPGVHVRDEDGYGNFPNISLRGTDSVRSAKTTLMEDGILMSPAPYTFPAAYHTPRIGRMSGVEAFKGSTQIRFGPHTTGGVLNFLSIPFVNLPNAPDSIPTPGKAPLGKAVVPSANASSPRSASEGYLKSTFGSDNTWINHGWWGHTAETSAGTAGVLIELFHNQSDGFRHIDKSDATPGFTLIEPMFRAFWEPDTALKQRFEFRFGYSNFDDDETHLGLTDRDLRADPQRRYTASQLDNFSSEQFRWSLKHIMEPSDSVRVETAAYYSWYTRNWYKLNDIRPTAEGPFTPLATAVAGGGLPLDILRGDAAGQWRIRAGDRDFYMFGLQSQLDWGFETGSIHHDLTAGLRLHYDTGKRFERDDLATTNAQGKIVQFQTGRQGAAGNRIEDVTAFALFVEDKIRLGRLTVKPGVRWEHMDMAYQDRATSGPDLSKTTGSDSGTADVIAPGISLNYDLTDSTALFAGYCRGFSNPAPREFLKGDAQMELTDGFELGARYTGSGVQAQLTGFYTNFHDMVANEGLGGLGTIEDSNAGDARLYGIEGAIRWDPLQESRGDWRLPLRGSATWTHSEFTRGNPAADAGSIYSGATPGNELPYVPRFTASAGFGVEYRNFGLHLDSTFISEMHGTASNATDLRDINGNPDARYGKTDKAVIVDLSAHYQVNENIRLVFGISNLADKAYITSRLPQGARANQPRSFFAGVEMHF
ncbi:MAG: TonB-dependent receptor [Verrucomicrobiales bacterium]|nr:TonB-dependent receptor [Verrucomicrobiales bacterium]